MKTKPKPQDVWIAKKEHARKSWEVVNGLGGLLAYGISEDKARLIAAAPKTLIGCQIAYTILADIRHNWTGRHTPEGQAALIALRDAISDATGANPQDVQDEYSSANIQKAMSQS